MIRKLIERMCNDADMSADAKCPKFGSGLGDHWNFSAGVRACRDVGCSFACLGRASSDSTSDMPLESRSRGVQRSRFASSDIAVRGGQ